MINKLRYGMTNTFLIPGERGYLLVDTDYAGTMSSFYSAIKQYDIKVSDISYVLATHYHPDHIGLVSELMKQGVKLLVIDTQCPHIHYSDEIFARERRLNYEPIHEADATFGTDGVFNQIADVHNSYYMVQQDDKQIFVTVTDEFIESRIMAKKITGNKFEMGDYKFQMAVYKVEK